MPLRVLIVDTDIRFVEQARRHLEACGHHGAHVDVSRVTQRAEQWRADLVIASAELPLVHQGELLSALHDVDQRPAVLLTASMDRFDLAWQAWHKGGDELLLKPMLNAAELHCAIATARQNALCPQRSVVTTPEQVRLSA